MTTVNPDVSLEVLRNSLKKFFIGVDAATTSLFSNSASAANRGGREGCKAATTTQTQLFAVEAQPSSSVSWLESDLFSTHGSLHGGGSGGGGGGPAGGPAVAASSTGGGAEQNEGSFLPTSLPFTATTSISAEKSPNVHPASTQQQQQRSPQSVTFPVGPLPTMAPHPPSPDHKVHSRHGGQEAVTSQGSLHVGPDLSGNVFQSAYIGGGGGDVSDSRRSSIAVVPVPPVMSPAGISPIIVSSPNGSLPPVLQQPQQLASPSHRKLKETNDVLSALLTVIEDLRCAVVFANSSSGTFFDGGVNSQRSSSAPLSRIASKEKDTGGGFGNLPSSSVSSGDSMDPSRKCSTSFPSVVKTDTNSNALPTNSAPLVVNVGHSRPSNAGGGGGGGTLGERPSFASSESLGGGFPQTPASATTPGGGQYQRLRPMKSEPSDPVSSLTLKSPGSAVSQDPNQRGFSVDALVSTTTQPPQPQSPQVTSPRSTSSSSSSTISPTTVNATNGSSTTTDTLSPRYAVVTTRNGNYPSAAAASGNSMTDDDDNARRFSITMPPTCAGQRTGNLRIETQQQQQSPPLAPGSSPGSGGSAGSKNASPSPSAAAAAGGGGGGASPAFFITTTRMNNLSLNGAGGGRIATQAASSPRGPYPDDSMTRMGSLGGSAADRPILQVMPIPSGGNLLTDNNPGENSSVTSPRMDSVASVYGRSIARTTAKAENTTDDAGVKVLNHYVIMETLGQGSGGRVKLAYSLDRNIPVAIKITSRARRAVTDPFGRGHDAKELAFRREIAIMKKLRHKNIVQLYEVIDDPQSSKLYLVMQYIDSGSVGKVFADGSCERLDLGTLLSVARQVSAGLEYLHRHHIVHRDIKPENVLLSSDRRAYLSDFGISVFLGHLGALAQKNHGTPHFMPPECFRHEDNDDNKYLLTTATAAGGGVGGGDGPTDAELLAQLSPTMATQRVGSVAPKEDANNEAVVSNPLSDSRTGAGGGGGGGGPLSSWTAAESITTAKDSTTSVGGSDTKRGATTTNSSGSAGGGLVVLEVSEVGSDTPSGGSGGGNGSTTLLVSGLNTSSGGGGEHQNSSLVTDASSSRPDSSGSSSRPMASMQRMQSLSIDIWGLGVTLYVLTTGHLPFRKVDDIRGATQQYIDERLLRPGAFKYFEPCTEDSDLMEALRETIQQMLQVDPLMRPDVGWVRQEFKKLDKEYRARRGSQTQQQEQQQTSGGNNNISSNAVLSDEAAIRQRDALNAAAATGGSETMLLSVPRTGARGSGIQVNDREIHDAVTTVVQDEEDERRNSEIAYNLSRLLSQRR